MIDIYDDYDSSYLDLSISFESCLTLSDSTDFEILKKEKLKDCNMNITEFYDLEYTFKHYFKMWFYMPCYSLTNEGKFTTVIDSMS